MESPHSPLWLHTALGSQTAKWSGREGKWGKHSAQREEAITAVPHASRQMTQLNYGQILLPFPQASHLFPFLYHPASTQRSALLLGDTFAIPLSQHLPMQSVCPNRLCSKKNLSSFPPTPHPYFHRVIINCAQEFVLCFLPQPRWLGYTLLSWGLRLQM